jgi:hypothetical protein
VFAPQREPQRTRIPHAIHSGLSPLKPIEDLYAKMKTDSGICSMAAQRCFDLQLRFFIFGALLFVLWHVVEMIVRRWA